MKKLIGTVTAQEREEIKTLFERKNGLTELFKSIDASNETLYNKVIADMGKTTSAFQKWWDDTSIKYAWESDPESRWEIDFEDCSIYLVKN